MTKVVDEIFDDEVTTGATLSNGTTVSGNTAFHLGNDGQGSGLDAEFVDGGDVAVSGDTWNLSPSTTAEGDVFSSFSTPCSEPRGLGVDSSDCIWLADKTAVSIYELDASGNVQSQFASPSDLSRGVGLDSGDCIWHADTNNECIYELNQSGVVQSQFTAPGNEAEGIGIDSSGCIWNSDDSDNSIYKISQSGSNQNAGFASPSEIPRGLDVDSTDCIWVNAGNFNNDCIYKVNQSGTIQTEFADPDNAPQGLGIDSLDIIWHVQNQTVYEISTGQTLYSLDTLQ